MYETRNLLRSGNKPSSRAIGKAEHLRCLLLEWMNRNDKKRGFYSDKKYNPKGMNGLIWEIRNRQSWKQVDFWISDRSMTFGKVADKTATGGGFTRTEYIYMGRTNPGKVQIRSISVKGPGANYFTIDKRGPTSIGQGGHLRVAVKFYSNSPVSIANLNAWVEVVVVAKNGARTEKVEINQEL